jgi:hypothetical protein
MGRNDRAAPGVKNARPFLRFDWRQIILMEVCRRSSRSVFFGMAQIRVLTGFLAIGTMIALLK